MRLTPVFLGLVAFANAAAIATSIDAKYAITAYFPIKNVANQYIEKLK